MTDSRPHPSRPGDHAAATDRALAPGDMVLAVSIVETRWIEPGDTVRVAPEHLGEATVTFEP